MNRLHWVFFLPVLAGPVFAQISFPNCTVVGYQWSYNSLNQNPCNVAASLASVCSEGEFTIPPLPPSWKYTGPSVGHDTMCQCNTVVYSLASACGGCQGTSWISWSEWSFNCSSGMAPPSTFPFTIPEGTGVPHWAYLDITDSWNFTAAQRAGDSPETKAGASSPPNQKKSHSGSIAGAAVGALVGVSLLIGIIFWYLRRRRSRPEVQQETSTVNEAFVNVQSIPSPVSAYHTEIPTTTRPSAGHVARTEVPPASISDGAAPIPGGFGLPLPNDSMGIGGFYNPSDPTTFPRPLVPPSMSGIQAMNNRGNVDNDGSAGSTYTPQYRGLPQV